jgi:phosphoglucomutase
MTSKEKFDFWFQNDYFDENTKKELYRIKDNPEEIEESFYKDLEFGTGGLRGVIGPGTNRMNVYTVRKASQGVANYVIKSGDKERGIVIAFDSRHKSPEFAYEVARVFATNGIKSYIFDELRPTPELSFAVRYLKTAAGIVVTASHNPKQYNGYKVYGKDGAQLSLGDSDAVFNEIEKITDITEIKPISKDEAIKKGLIAVVGGEIDNDYISKLKLLRVNKEISQDVKDDLKIVYTPLHGTGNKLVRRVLNETGFKNVIVVKEQELPDPDFSTVKSPNPEETAALQLAINLAVKDNSDFVMGTDPDSDRVGIAVRNHKGEFVPLTGNQTGCLLTEYILSQKSMNKSLPVNGFIIKTIVTTEMVRKIAKKYNVEVVECLTGFKFIGEQIRLLDEFGDKNFIFGFEESYGYLAGTYVRDKDAVVACMLIAEMAAYYKSRNMTIYDGLIEMFEEYGYCFEGMSSFTLAGLEGLEKIKATMETMRKDKPTEFGNFEAKAIRDYQKSERFEVGSENTEVINLPESNVLYFELTDGSWFCIRPSGTEPKIKIYYGICEKTFETAQNKLIELKNGIFEVIGKLLD